MEIKFFQEYKTMSAYGASMVTEHLNKKPDLLLCTATGGSPLGLYARLVDHFQHENELFRELRILKLDEWVGLKEGAEGSCERYLQTRLIKPLEISRERYISFDPDVRNKEQECQRVEEWLKKEGPIDLCILGLGKNGHLGFNEPGTHVTPGCHVATLTPESQNHAMIANADFAPFQGLTLGMGDILSSKKVLLIISGEDKEEAKKSLMSQEVTTDFYSITV